MEEGRFTREVLESAGLKPVTKGISEDYLNLLEKNLEARRDFIQKYPDYFKLT